MQDLLHGKPLTQHVDVKFMGSKTSNYKSTIRKYSTQFYLVEAIPKSYFPSPLPYFTFVVQHHLCS